VNQQEEFPGLLIETWEATLYIEALVAPVVSVSASFHIVHGMFEGLPRLVNVPERALLQPAMPSLIDSAGNVLACFIQKIQCRPHGAIRVSTDRRGRAVGVPSLIAHRFTHFMDGAFNFLDCVVPGAGESRPGIRLQQLARFPQVG
jgi:hypothetical protein